MTADTIKDVLEDLKEAVGGGEDLVRFRPDPSDDAIGNAVRAVSNEGLNEIMREALSEDSDTSEKIALFSARRILQARRQPDLRLLNEALFGFSLLPAVDDVPWNSWFMAALVLGQSLGLELGSVVGLFGGPDSAGGRRASVAIEASHHVTTLAQCRLVEVTTTYGLGLIELPPPRDIPAASMRDAPLIDNDPDTYQPVTNLAQAAVLLADELGSVAGVTTSPILYQRLPTVYFSLDLKGSWVPTTGCLGFAVLPAGGDPAIDVVVAELISGPDTTRIANSATNDEGQGAVAEGSRLVLFSPEPSFDDKATPAVFDYRTYESQARAALTNPASA